MTRLIHLNGPPGIGKSTLASRYADEHPGVLNCDVDVLRTLIGGWAHDFEWAGSLIRPAALAMIQAYLENGQDVVLPQMLVDPAELARFEAAATGAGAQFVERVPMDSASATVASIGATAAIPVTSSTRRTVPAGATSRVWWVPAAATWATGQWCWHSWAPTGAVLTEAA